MNKFHFISVGAEAPYQNGNMAICNRLGKSIVFDLNKRKNDDGSEYSAYDLLKKFVRNEGGILVVDLLVISHLDNDHYGDFETLERKINEGKLRIKKILIPSYDPKEEADFKEDDHPDYKALKRVMAKTEHKFLYSGDRLNNIYPEFTGILDFKVLNPVRGTEYTDANDAALVLLVSVSGKNILLPSDVRDTTWLSIREEHGTLLKNTSIDYLVLAHHGSIRFFDGDYDLSSKMIAVEKLKNYKALNEIEPQRFILPARTKFPDCDQAGDNPPHHATYVVIAHWLQKKSISKPDSRIVYLSDDDYTIPLDSNISVGFSTNYRPYQSREDYK